MVDDGVTLPTVHKVTKKMFPKIQPCVDKYLEQFSTPGSRKFIIHDCKVKKIMCGAGFHAWHYENGNVSDGAKNICSANLSQ